MRAFFVGLVVATLGVGGYWLVVTLPHTGTTSTAASPSSTTTSDRSPSFSTQEVGFGAEPSTEPIGYGGQYTEAELQSFERPAGPPRVGLQVGHLDNDEVPAELSGLTSNGAGATWGPYTERAAMETIVELAAARLRAAGVEVDVLPATVPPGYEADAFVSVHADGNQNEAVRGFKAADFSHDYSGLSQYLEDSLYTAYASSTNLPEDESITYYMSGYYAFNWWRYEHAVHPLTPAVILETGFLTNAADRALIINEPEQVAEGIATSILDFLATYSLADAAFTRLTYTTPPFTGVFQCFPVELDPNDRDVPPEDCRPGLVLENGRRVGLSPTAAVSTSTITDLTASSTITVDGTYTPMVGVRDLFWYDFGVRGVVMVTRLTPSPAR